MFKVIRIEDKKELGKKETDFSAHDLIFDDIEKRGLGHLTDDDLEDILKEYKLIEIYS